MNKTDNEKNTMDLGTLIKWVTESEDNTQDARATSERCRDYYDSKQLTDEETRALKKRKQAPVVINRIKPKIDGLKGMERTNKTTAKAYPRTPTHEKASEAASESIRFVLQDNMWGDIRSNIWDNLIIEGCGGCEVIVKPQGKDFKIVLNHIRWDRFFYDPHGMRKDFQDCRYLGQIVWMDYDEALSENPDGKDILEVMQSGSQTYDDKPRWMDARKRVKIVEMYYRKDGDIYYCRFTRGGFLEEPKISPFKNEEGETEWPYEFGSAFVSREGGRYGAVLQLLDVQDEINKRRSKALHLMSVRQVRLERGAVEDLNKTRQELAKPDGVIETTPGMEFEILKTGDMAAAQFNLLTEAKQEIDAVGVNAALSGKDPRDQSGVALQKRMLAGQTELAPLFDALKNIDIRVYRKVWNRIRQYWKSEKWLRVTDDENNLRWVGLNKPVTKGELLLQRAQEQKIPPEQLQQLQAQISQDPMMQEVVNTENDIATLDVDIIIDEVPDTITTQIEDFQVLGEMVKSGFQMPPEAVILASPLSNKEKILKMMKEAPQLSPQHQKQMEQMQEEGKKLAAENQQLKSNSQESTMRIQADMKEGQMKIQSEQMLEQQRLQSEMMLAKMTAAMDSALERWKAELDARTKIAIATIQTENRPKEVTAAG